MFRSIPVDAIPGEWGRLSGLLAPAVRVDPNQTMQGLYRRLVTGQAAVLDATFPNARGVLVVETIEDQGMVLWLTHIAGSVDGGPRQWLETMRGLMAGFERIAKGAGYRQMRVCGRDWRRVLTDYSLFDEATNELRKDI